MEMLGDKLIQEGESCLSISFITEKTNPEKLASNQFVLVSIGEKLEHSLRAHR